MRTTDKGITFSLTVMDTTNNNQTQVREQLLLSDRELCSKWATLAKLIRAYEDVNWSNAKTKAMELIRHDEAKTYLQRLRQNFTNPLIPKLDLQQDFVSQKETLKEEAFKISKYQQNYERFILLAPDIELVLKSKEVQHFQRLEGSSSVTGYEHIYFELLNIKGSQYVFTLSSCDDLQGGQANRCMTLLLDINRIRLESLRFEDKNTDELVYNDLYRRNLVNVDEKKVQNKYLNNWLKQLITQKHCLKWIDVKDLIEKEEEIRLQREEQEAIDRQRKIKQQEAKEQEEKFNLLVERISRKFDIADTWKIEQYLSSSLTYEENVKQVQKVLTRKRILNIEALKKENFSILLKLIPDLENRLKYRHTKGTIQTNLISWEITWARMKSSNVLQLVINQKFRSQRIKNPPAIITLDFENNKLWLFANALGFNAQDEYIEQGKAEQKEERYARNFNFYELLENLQDENAFCEWENQPDDSQIPDFEKGQVKLSPAHILEGFTQRHIDWINENQQGLKVHFGEPIDKNTLSLEDLIWYQTKRPPVRLNSKGEIIPIDHKNL